MKKLLLFFGGLFVVSNVFCVRCRLIAPAPSKTTQVTNRRPRRVCNAPESNIVKKRSLKEQQRIMSIGHLSNPLACRIATLARTVRKEAEEKKREMNKKKLTISSIVNKDNMS